MKKFFLVVSLLFGVAAPTSGFAIGLTLSPLRSAVILVMTPAVASTYGGAWSQDRAAPREMIMNAVAADAAAFLGGDEPSALLVEIMAEVRNTLSARGENDVYTDLEIATQLCNHLQD